jgi:hypothetical protein
MQENKNNNTQETMEKCKQKMEEMIGGNNQKEMCPMSSMCKGIKEKPGAGFLLMVPGAILNIRRDTNSY